MPSSKTIRLSSSDIDWLNVNAVAEPLPVKLSVVKVLSPPPPPPAIAPQEVVYPSNPPVVVLYLKYPAAGLPGRCAVVPVGT